MNVPSSTTATATAVPSPGGRITPTVAQRSVVTLDKLTKRYGHHVAVDALSFEVPAGQVIGLLGPNGAGKTTAMKMLVGLVTPSSGRAEILGTDVRSKGFAQAVKRVGALIESPALYLRLSARQNLELQARALGVKADRGRIDDLLDLVDLSDRAGDHAGTYSLGMKQRLGIAVAMLGSPELVILDEPANGLDPAGIVEIRKLLRRLPEMGTTVLVSSHQLSEVQQACDRLVVLADGRLVATGTTDEILRRFSSSHYTVRLEPTEVADAVQHLAAMDIGVAATTIDTIELSIPDHWGGRDLNRALAERGIYASEVRHDTVTLEEAFLAMTTPEGANHV